MSLQEKLAELEAKLAALKTAQGVDNEEAALAAIAESLVQAQRDVKSRKQEQTSKARQEWGDVLATKVLLAVKDVFTEEVRQAWVDKSVAGIRVWLEPNTKILRSEATLVQQVGRRSGNKSSTGTASSNAPRKQYGKEAYMACTTQAERDEDEKTAMRLAQEAISATPPKYNGSLSYAKQHIFWNLMMQQRCRAAAKAAQPA